MPIQQSASNLKVDVVTMGCSKNLMDSERLLAGLVNAGITVRHNPDVVDCDTVIINTCGFIGDAKEESIDMILSMVQAKNERRVGKLYVMGCLSERYMEDLRAELPEVDRWYGKFDWHGIVSSLTGRDSSSVVKPWDRVLTTHPHSAYLKISEGCNRRCAFCAIPLITGTHKSRPMADILMEVNQLVSRGVKEFNVIAQDLSSYGMDISHRSQLAELISRMSDIQGVEWVRLHYAYPSNFPMELLDVIAERDNVCKYLDMALQHISDKVLNNMRRNITGSETKALIEEIRRRVPDIHLRTTLMVGFPGEGEKEFEELMDFVKTTRFERMGAFAYSEEENTIAAKTLTDEIPQPEKEKRLETIMKIQEDVSEELQKSKVGTIFKVIIDEEEGDYFVGRTQWDSPEVDPEVLIEKESDLQVGEFYNVAITDFTAFELYGKVIR